MTIIHFIDWIIRPMEDHGALAAAAKAMFNKGCGQQNIERLQQSVSVPCQLDSIIMVGLST